MSRQKFRFGVTKLIIDTSCKTIDLLIHEEIVRRKPYIRKTIKFQNKFSKILVFFLSISFEGKGCDPSF